MSLIEIKGQSRAWALALTVMLTLFSVGCSGKQEITVNGTEIFFDGTTVTEADANKLGEALNESGFSDGQEKSVELTKEGDTWVFRMVSVDGAEDDVEIVSAMRLMCLELSCEFDGQPFLVDLCDDQLKTKKQFSGLKGTLHKVDTSNVYLDGVSEDVLAPFQKVLAAEQFEEVNFHLEKVGEEIKVRLVANNEALETAEYDEAMNNLAKTISTEVFEGNPITLLLCDDWFEDKKTIPSGE